MPKEYKVTNIAYNTDENTSAKLPKELIIQVPSNLQDSDEITEYISDQISDITGWLHYGFSVEPEIK